MLFEETSEPVSGSPCLVGDGQHAYLHLYLKVDESIRKSTNRRASNSSSDASGSKRTTGVNGQ